MFKFIVTENRIHKSEMPTDILGQASKISLTTSIDFLFLNDRELHGLANGKGFS